MAVDEVKEAPRVNFSRSRANGCGRKDTLLQLGSFETPGQLSSVGVESNLNVCEI